MFYPSQRYHHTPAKTNKQQTCALIQYNESYGKERKRLSSILLVFAYDVYRNGDFLRQEKYLKTLAFQQFTFFSHSQASKLGAKLQ